MKLWEYLFLYQFKKKKNALSSVLLSSVLANILITVIPMYVKFSISEHLCLRDKTTTVSVAC